MKRLVLALLGLLAASPALAQWQVPLGAVPIGRGAGVTGFSSSYGVPTNVLNTQTANYTLQTTDCGKTIQAGTGSTGFFTITVPAVAGFSTTCAVTITNGDTIRWKGISGFTGCSSQKVIGPLQTCAIAIVNGAWTALSRPGRWRPPANTTVNFNTNFSLGTDVPGATDGLGTTTAAFKSIEYCFLFAADQIDFNTVDQTQVVCNMAAGVTDTQGMHTPVHALVGAQGGAALTIKGGAGSIVSVTGADAIAAYFGTVLYLDGLTIRSNQNGLNAQWGSKVYLSNVTFGGGGVVPAGAHILLSEAAVIEQAGAVAIAGNAAYGLFNAGGHYRTQGLGFAFSADATFSQSFLLTTGPSFTAFSATTLSLNAHTVIGKRFAISNGAYAATGLGNGDLNYFPGNVAGTVTTGGTYDTVMTQTVAQGGTGNQTLTANSVLLGEGTSAIGFAAIGTSGRLFVDKGAATDPAFVAAGGDCTTAFSTTINFTCTKTNGTSFGALATVTAGTGVATAAANATNSAGGFTTSPVANANIANASTTVAGQTCTLGSTCGLSSITNSLAGAVTMTTAVTYYDGPSVAQGSTGTWFSSGNATISAPQASDQILCKLWDGTTLIDSGYAQTGNGLLASIHLSGYLASPAGNLRISCTNATRNGGTIATGNGIDAKASTVSAFRINWLLERDLNPASNDNNPVYLERAA